MGGYICGASLICLTPNITRIYSLITCGVSDGAQARFNSVTVCVFVVFSVSSIVKSSSVHQSSSEACQPPVLQDSIENLETTLSRFQNLVAECLVYIEQVLVRQLPYRSVVNGIGCVRRGLLYYKQSVSDYDEIALYSIRV